MNSSVIIKLAETEAELAQILLLQDANHFSMVSQAQKQSDGFVTVQHTLPLLKQMQAGAPQIVAVFNGKVVGYALSMLTTFSQKIPVLAPMFQVFSHLTYQQKALSNYHYYVMGQICIATAYRGQGFFKKLYLKHKEVFRDDFDFCLTEVSVNNPRSLKAHENVGFKIIHCYTDEQDTWNIMLWDWR